MTTINCQHRTTKQIRQSNDVYMCATFAYSELPLRNFHTISTAGQLQMRLPFTLGPGCGQRKRMGLSTSCPWVHFFHSLPATPYEMPAWERIVRIIRYA